MKRPLKKISLLVLLFLFLLPMSALGARTMGNPFLEVRYLMYKKYILYGDVSFQYHYQKTTTETDTTRYSRSYDTFTQQYRLNLKSYIYDPRIVIFTTGAAFNLNDSGSTTKSYYLDLDFFKLLPFRFNLYGRYTDADAYRTTNLGMSVSFIRKKKRLTFRNMREWSQWLMQQRQNRLNRQQQQNLNQNLNQNIQKNENLYNQGQNQQQLMSLKPKSTLIERLAPVFYHFDLDRTETRYVNTSDKRLYYNSSFRASGYDQTRTHHLSYDFSYNYTDSQNYMTYNTEEKIHHDFDFHLMSVFHKKSKLGFRTVYRIYDEAFYRRELYSDIGYSSRIGESAWSYNLSGSYTRINNSNQYTTSGGLGTSYSGRGYSINFHAGAGYHYIEAISQGNYYLSSSLGASKRVSSAMTLGLFSGLNIGSEASSYSGTARSIHVLSRRFRLINSYTYSATTGRYTRYFVGASAKTEEHRFTSSFMGNLGWGNLYSNASYARQISNGQGSKDLSFSNSLNTVVKRVVLTFTGGYAYNKADDASSGQNTLRIGNSISFSPLYRLYVRLSQHYSRTWSKDQSSYSYSITDGLFWRIRMLFWSLDYTFTYSRFSTGTKTREHRVYIRVTRPFYL